MDVDSIVQIINSVGFPIVACCALFYFINKTMAENTTATKELADGMQEINRTLSNLDETLNDLKEMIETNRDKIEENTAKTDEIKELVSE